jgi:hypothetical protein
MKGNATDSATCDPFSAAVKPSLPTAPAIMMEGVMLIHRVIKRRSHGAKVQLSAPSLTIWPAIVHTTPAEIPERKS